jgi:hypothetical protein
VYSKRLPPDQRKFIHLVVNTSLRSGPVAAQVYVSTAVFIGGKSVANIFHQVRLDLPLEASRMCYLIEGGGSCTVWVFVYWLVEVLAYQTRWWGGGGAYGTEGRCCLVSFAGQGGDGDDTDGEGGGQHDGPRCVLVVRCPCRILCMPHQVMCFASIAAEESMCTRKLPCSRKSWGTPV